MTLNFVQLQEMLEGMKELANDKLPFKLSLLLAKNISLLDKEMEFYIKQEQEFALKYLAVDENGMFVQEREGVFKIKSGMEDECRQARTDLNQFSVNVDLHRIPVSLMDNLDITPKQLIAIESILNEEE